MSYYAVVPRPAIQKQRISNLILQLDPGIAYVGEGQPEGAASLGSNPATGLAAVAMLARPKTTLAMESFIVNEG